jgi:hypothetical protein
MKLAKYFFVFIILALFAAPLFASAQIQLNLAYPEFGNITLDKAKCDQIALGLLPGKICGQNLAGLAAWLYYFILGISALAAFVMLVWGGIQWLTSGAIPSQAGEARDKLKSAVLGLLLILASFLIIQIINPQLTVLKQPGLAGIPGVVPTLSPVSGGSGPPVGCGPGSSTLTIDALPGISIPFPVTPPFTHTLDWSTTTGCSACTGQSSGPSIAFANIWNKPSVLPTGSDIIDISPVSSIIADGDRIEFSLICGSVVETKEILATSGGGIPPQILTFEVREQGGSTWHPASAAPYTCCENAPSATDFPISRDLEFSWTTTNATNCVGEDNFSGHVLGALNSGSPGPILNFNNTSFPVAAGAPYTFRLRCTGTALPDAVSEIHIEVIQ